MSSLYSLSQNNSVMSFNIPLEVNIEDFELPQDPHELDLEPEPAQAIIQLVQEAEGPGPDDFHFTAGGLPSLPFEPPRERAVEIVRKKEADEHPERITQRGVNRRFEGCTSKRNL
jgi:hypothetical protein